MFSSFYFSNMTQSKPKKSVTFKGTRFLLTYAQCSIPKDDLFAYLESLEGVHSVILAQEQHKDEGIHYHACVRFVKRRELGPRFFDFQGYHPSIEVVRNEVAMTQYILKDDVSPSFSIKAKGSLAKTTKGKQMLMTLYLKQGYSPTDIFVEPSLMQGMFKNPHEIYT